MQERIDLATEVEMGFTSLGSGSRGNGTLVRMADRLLLVDCGFTLKEVTLRLRRLGIALTQLDALLVTHEHSDHAGGIGPLARKCGAPVYMSHGTARQVRDLKDFDVRTFDSHRGFEIGAVGVTPVSVPHDAREPTQFVFETRYGGGFRRIGILTDLGHVTRHVLDRYRGCHGLLLESNYDPDMLWQGRYPPALKRRIAGNLGHLANNQALEFLVQVTHDDLQQVVVGHVSEENNSPSLLNDLYREPAAAVHHLHLATQEEGSGWARLD